MIFISRKISSAINWVLSLKVIFGWISTPGDFITDLSGLIFRTKARRDIKALSNTKLYTIYRTDYELIGGEVPNWDKLEKLFIAKCFITLEDRVFSFLSMDSKERYEHLFAYKPSLFNEVPLQYLASMLGMSPETLSRIRSNSWFISRDQPEDVCNFVKKKLWDIH